jgi:5-aminolevulinate synthase
MTLALERSIYAEFFRLHAELDRMKAVGLYRKFTPCSYITSKPGKAGHQDDVIDVWCSNDYLGMNYDPDVIRAQVRAAKEHGTGNGGSRTIAGTSVAHEELEQTLAAWHRTERALIFNSGYTANVESLSVLSKAIPNCMILSDELNHRSLIEGIRSGGAKKQIYRHNDVRHLEELLKALPEQQPKIIVFESIYSMDGDVAPISEICDLAERHNALTYVDETHAIGVTGPTGAGVCEEIGETRVDLLQGVFGKALGTTGGYIAGPDVVLDFIRSKSPGFIFTTTIPRASLEATKTSISLVQQRQHLRDGLKQNVRLLKQLLDQAGISYIPGTSHLVPVLMPSGADIKSVARILMTDYRIYVQPINYPSVPLGAERLRITTPPYRTELDIRRFVNSLAAAIELSRQQQLSLQLPVQTLECSG